MRISVSIDPSLVQLQDASNFAAFDVIVDPADAAESAVAEALGDLGRGAGEDHLWISVDGVRTLAGEAADADWETGYAAMIRYAESKNWLTDDATMIKAHIERP